MRKSARIFVVAVAALSLAGCGIFFPSARQRAEKNSPGFKNGYSDGCASAAARGANYREPLVRDEAAYGSDKAYRAGWASGLTNCRTATTVNPATPGVGPIPDNNPGGRSY